MSKNSFRRILIIRTDRIGDVILSTPVIRSLREAFPHAHLAMMVQPHAREIIEGNPYLDEVILFEKRGAHRGLIGSLGLVRALRRAAFDLAVILHPTTRVHLVACLARIPYRIGYDKKWGGLLTHRIADRRHLGIQHEIDNALDVVRHLGITPKRTAPLVPITTEHELKIETFLKAHQADRAKLVVLHPGASCLSKRWPVERFADLADRLAERFGVRPVVVTSPEEAMIGQRVVRGIRHQPINACGQLSLGELASLLRRARLFISNDSGPVHMAVAVGTPVIALFGRNHPGLNLTRWRPVGERDIAIYKDVGCTISLTHDSTIESQSLKELSVDEVLHAAEQFHDRLA